MVSLLQTEQLVVVLFIARLEIIRLNPESSYKPATKHDSLADGVCNPVKSTDNR